ncbi:MAG: hypothetical protein ACKO5F_10580 [Synechococcus sp.]
MLDGLNQKELFDHWLGRVVLKNLKRIGAQEHVTTQELRHDCTNYDQLRNLPEVQSLDELERCRMIAIIKYQCTAKALQRRTGLLRDYAKQCDENIHRQREARSRLGALLQKLKRALQGQSEKIQGLEAKLKALDAENAALRAELQESETVRKLRDDLDSLQRSFDAEVKRRKQLARNNQSLGGRLAHTNRYRKERDELREALQSERECNEALRRELEQLKALLPDGLALEP